MEFLRDVTIVVVVDTNKQTHKEVFDLHEGECVRDLLKKVDQWVKGKVEDL